MRPRYRVVVDRHTIVKLGQTSFRLKEASKMVEDLKARGYADAHTEPYWDETGSKEVDRKSTFGRKKT